MEQYKKLKWQFELSWWVFVIAVAIGAMLPIVINVPEYPFFVSNLLFILSFLLFVRWLFLLRFSWFAQNKWIKLIILFLVIPMMLLLMDHFTNFQAYVDDYGLQTFMGHLSFDDYHSMAAYIRWEMLLFGVGSLIATFLLAFRMIISIWRVQNRGTV
jgi:hypothetical protein